MSYLNIHLVLFLLFCSGGLVSQPRTEVIIADHNGDGILDTLRTISDSGSGFGHKEVAHIDGKTQQKYKLQTTSSFGSFISLIEVPKRLAAPDKKALLMIMADKILPPPAINPDPSLRWIIKGGQTKQQPNDHPYFDLFIDPTPPWISAPFHLPESYYLPFGKGTYVGEFLTRYDSPEAGLLVYYGHNHRGPQQRFSGQPYQLSEVTGQEGKIYKTHHGLIQKNEVGQHRWIFVTDGVLTGAPDKLRWSSIGKVEVWNDQLLLLQHRKPVSSGESIFLIDLENGRTAQLRSELFSEPDDFLTFKVEDDELLLKGRMPGESRDGGTFKRFSLRTLREKLLDF